MLTIWKCKKIKIEYYKLFLIKVWQWAFFTPQTQAVLSSFPSPSLPSHLSYSTQKETCSSHCPMNNIQYSFWLPWFFLQNLSLYPISFIKQGIFPNGFFLRWNSGASSYNHKIFSLLKSLTIPWIQMTWKSSGVHKLVQPPWETFWQDPLHWWVTFAVRGPCAWKSPRPVLKLYCLCLGILSNFWTRGSEFSHITGTRKLCR